MTPSPCCVLSLSKATVQKVNFTGYSFRNEELIQLIILGDKCKFSHDLAVERKGEKRSMYVDAREAGETETMADWDETKLKEVVESKHATEKTNATAIICKFFIEAVEKSLYGWFWECPNGKSCIYRHALPPGYVLKKDKKKEDKRDEISLEELIEKERAGLGSTTTKVTLETFLAWKKRKIEEKRLTAMEDEKKKLKDYKSGKQFGISGREMFSFNPDLVHDGMDEGDEALEYTREVDENENDFKEIDFSALSAGLTDVNDFKDILYNFLIKLFLRSMEVAQLQQMIVSRD